MTGSPPLIRFGADAPRAGARRARAVCSRSEPGHEDQELLAAETVGEVERAQLLAQQVGDLLEDDVADGVAAGVVDRA